MNELKHHGILGQKWGVRRFQNKDGTYTSNGKDRYKKSSKNPKKMSDAELDEALNRKRKESEYRRLKANENSVNKFIDTAKKVIVTGAATAIAAAIIKNGKKYMTKQNAKSVISVINGKGFLPDLSSIKL